MDDSTGSAQLSSTQQQQIEDTMFETMKSHVLPSLMKGMITQCVEYCESELFPQMKSELMDAAMKMVTESKYEMRESFHKSQFSKQDAMQFMERHSKIFNEHEEKRDDAFRKATRQYEIRKLYQEGLDKSPTYVPRKFRKDKYFVRTAAELDVLKRREKNDLLAEMEILQLREDDNRKIIELQDDLVAIFVNEQVQNPYLKEEILRTWNSNNKKEMEAVTETWKKKISGLRIQFEKDKNFITQYNKKRVRQKNEINAANTSLPNGGSPTDDASTRQHHPPNENANLTEGSSATVESQVPEDNPTTASAGEEVENESVVLSAHPNSTMNIDQEISPGNDSVGVTTEEVVSGTAINDNSTDVPEDRERQEITDTMVLETVESDEYFTDDETVERSDTQILFGDRHKSTEMESIVIDYFSTSEDDTDNENDEQDSDFRKEYNFRKAPRKSRASYTPREAQRQTTSQQGRQSGKKRATKARRTLPSTAPARQKTNQGGQKSDQRSSTSRATTSQMHK